MWIRSQNKRFLGQYKFLYLNNNKVVAETNIDSDYLGEYTTFERAMEVLDIIHLAIMESKKNYVFNMPKE